MTTTQEWKVLSVRPAVTPGKNFTEARFDVAARSGARVLKVSCLTQEQVDTLDLELEWRKR